MFRYSLLFLCFSDTRENFTFTSPAGSSEPAGFSTGALCLVCIQWNTKLHLFQKKHFTFTSTLTNNCQATNPLSIKSLILYFSLSFFQQWRSRSKRGIWDVNGTNSPSLSSNSGEMLHLEIKLLFYAISEKCINYISLGFVSNVVLFPEMHWSHRKRT